MMHHIKLLEVSLLDFFAQAVEDLLDLEEGEDHVPAQGHQGEHLHLLSLIVKQLRLGLGVVKIVLELSPDHGVSEGDGQASGKEVERVRSQLESNVAHRDIKVSNVSSD